MLPSSTNIVYKTSQFISPYRPTWSPDSAILNSVDYKLSKTAQQTSEQDQHATHSRTAVIISTAEISKCQKQFRAFPIIGAAR